MAPNEWYKKGFRGWTMLKKEGDGMTVPYQEVGKLARAIHEHLLPLKVGPFGNSPNPSCQVIAELKLQISSGPLTIVMYETVEEFVTAIDALPDPEPAEASSGDPGMQELRDAITLLFDERDKMRSTIQALQDQVTTLNREVSSLDIRSRSVKPM
jgi:hypothetical protein